MKIGILGSGDVARTLGCGFLKHGHDTMLGTRNTSKLAEWRADNAGAKVACIQGRALNNCEVPS